LNQSQKKINVQSIDRFTRINFSRLSSSKKDVLNFVEHNRAIIDSFNRIDTNDFRNLKKKNSNELNDNDDMNNFLWNESRKQNIYKLNVAHEIIMQTMKSYFVVLLFDDDSSHDLNNMKCTTWLKQKKMMFNDVMQHAWQCATLFIKKKKIEETSTWQVRLCHMKSKKYVNIFDKN
jgi:hypothetical protein